MKDTIADPKTPSQYNYENNELMHMLSKESRSQAKVITSLMYFNYLV